MSSIAASEYPSSPSRLRVCSPSRGGGRRKLSPGEPENITGIVVVSIFPSEGCSTCSKNPASLRYGSASRPSRRVTTPFGTSKLSSRHGFIGGLKDLADFDLVLAARKGIGATLDPFDRLFFRVHLEHPEPGYQFSELRERTVDDGPFASGEFDARPLRARL